MEKNETLRFIRWSSEIPISPHPGGEKQGEILTAVSSIPFLSPLNALSTTGFDFPVPCCCCQPASSGGVLTRRVASPPLHHGHRLRATVSMAWWDKHYQSHREKILFGVCDRQIVVSLLKNSTATLNSDVALSWSGYARMWLNSQEGSCSYCGSRKQFEMLCSTNFIQGSLTSDSRCFSWWGIADRAETPAWEGSARSRAAAGEQPPQPRSRWDSETWPGGWNWVLLPHRDFSFWFHSWLWQLQNKTVVEPWWFIPYNSCCFSVSCLN